jgi:starvation-inducible DNA-binding protein
METSERRAKTKTSEFRTNLEDDAVVEIGEALRVLLADVFSLYLKTKSLHWHIARPMIPGLSPTAYEHADQIFAMTDEIACGFQGSGAPIPVQVGQCRSGQRWALS